MVLFNLVYDNVVCVHQQGFWRTIYEGWAVDFVVCICRCKLWRVINRINLWIAIQYRRSCIVTDNALKTREPCGAPSYFQGEPPHAASLDFHMLHCRLPWWKHSPVLMRIRLFPRKICNLGCYNSVPHSAVVTMFTSWFDQSRHIKDFPWCKCMCNCNTCIKWHFVSMFNWCPLCCSYRRNGIACWLMQCIFISRMRQAFWRIMHEGWPVLFALCSLQMCPNKFIPICCHLIPLLLTTLTTYTGTCGRPWYFRGSLACYWPRSSHAAVTPARTFRFFIVNMIAIQ